MIDIERLLSWQAFNWLAGNSDGHAKNLALLYTGRTIQLAPFYDLVCTRAIARLDRRLAMGIGGETDPGKITSSHWDALAQRLRCAVALPASACRRHGRTNRQPPFGCPIRIRGEPRTYAGGCSESRALSLVNAVAPLT